MNSNKRLSFQVKSCAVTVLLLAVLPTWGCSSAGNSGTGGRTSFRGGLSLARDAWARGDYISALELLEEARFAPERSDNETELALLTGDCLLALKRYDEARTAYFRARSSNRERDNAAAYLVAMGLGQVHEAQGLWTAAERHYLEALAFTPDPDLQDRALLRLGKGSLKRGRLKRALAYRDRIHDHTVFGFEEFSRALDQQQPPRARTEEQASKVKLPSVLAPEILGRDVWAAEPIRPSGQPRPMGKPWRITVHHSAEPLLPPTAMKDAAAQMRSFQSYHQDNRGWADIGYHFVIDGKGRIWEGRAIKWEGAHAGNARLNKGNIGVCLMGNFVDQEPTPSQKDALEQLLSWLCEYYRIHPHFVTSHRAALRDVPGKSTLCPGIKLERCLTRLKARLPRP